MRLTFPAPFGIGQEMRELVLQTPPIMMIDQYDEKVICKVGENLWLTRMRMRLFYGFSIRVNKLKRLIL